MKSLSSPAAEAGPPVPWLNLAIFLLTLLVYCPSLGGGFIWDDAGHVTRSDLQSFAGLQRIWFEVGATQQYYPLLHSAFWLEHRIWGDAPLGYRLLNVLLHASSACLLGAILRRLAIPGAWLAAALFALHPVCVESVAWITEQKNTLSTLLYLSAGFVYLRYDTNRGAKDYSVATLLFLCALFSKTVTATLPAALLVVAWWRRGRVDVRRDVLPLVPWFALGIAAGLVTAWVEHRFIGAKGSEFDLTFLGRLLLAGRVAWFYAFKLAWPVNLSFNYPRWTLDPSSLLQWLFPIAALCVLGALVWFRKRGLLAGVLIFGGSLVPALGFVNVYPFIFSYVADHFQYLACIGLLVPLSAGIALVTRTWSATARSATCGLVLAVLGALTFQHCVTYRDDTTLYETTLRQNPESWLSHNNLAEALAEAGQVAEAIPHLQEALAFRPNFPEAENNLGHDLTLLGRAAEGIPHLERAIQLAPTFAQAYNNLGVALMELGRTDEGRAQFERALSLQSHYAGARFNLGLALARAGRTEEAITHFQQAVQDQPNYAAAELHWAIGLLLTGKFDQAVPHFERAIKLNPESPENELIYARALANAKRPEEAISHYQKALRLDPENREIHSNMATALRSLGRNVEAQHHEIEARRLGEAPAR